MVWILLSQFNSAQHVKEEDGGKMVSDEEEGKKTGLQSFILK